MTDKATAEHVNFYENTAEVQIRLVSTVVLYDGHPYYVLMCADHKDGIIRLYLDDIAHPDGPAHLRIGSIPLGSAPSMDVWLEANPKAGIIRKMMNSPAFKRYRPFPLGMCNHNGKVTYVERNPTRQTNQGLNQQMLQYHPVSLLSSRNKKRDDPGYNKFGTFPQLMSREIADTILGHYPTAEETLENLLDPRTENEGAAFHRKFALLRGPMDSIYLAYKEDVIGILSYGDFSVVKLGPAFRHCKEAVQELRMFQTVE